MIDEQLRDQRVVVGIAEEAGGQIAGDIEPDERGRQRALPGSTCATCSM